MHFELLILLNFYYIFFSNNISNPNNSPVVSVPSLTKLFNLNKLKVQKL